MRKATDESWSVGLNGLCLCDLSSFGSVQNNEFQQSLPDGRLLG